MSDFVIFVCTGLLIYWISRTLMLMEGPEEQVGQILESDLWWGRRILVSLRTMLGPPTQSIG